MNNIVILHLSDLHMSEKKLEDINIVIKALLEDIEKIKKNKKISIDFICFTGDLIWRGDFAEKKENQIELAFDNFILPLMEKINIEEKNFFIVPGNHEIDQTQIDKITEEGLKSKLKTRDEINEFLDTLENKYIRRINYFNQYRDFFAADPIWENKLASSYIRNQKDKQIGFACLNTSWRSTGSGISEKENLILGERQIYKAYESISNCDLKIALMHHPTDWLQYNDKKAIEPILSKFDIVLNGHLHDLDEKEITTRGQKTIFSTSGALFHGRTNYNGYSIIEVNPITYETTIFFREYNDNDRFQKAISISEDGYRNYKIDSDDPIADMGLNFIDTLKNKYNKKINNNLISSLIDEKAPENIDDVFVEPCFSKKSEYIKENNTNKNDITLNNIIRKDDNVVFIGKKEIGKTTLLNYISLYYFNNFSKLLKIPFIVDFRNRLPGLTPIEKEMVKFISNNSDYELSINKSKIIDLLESGSCILLFDNVEIDNSKKLDKLIKFVEKYPNNRFFFTVNENIFQTITDKEMPNLGCNYKKIFIQTLSSSGIKHLILKWFYNREIDIDITLEKVMFYFRQLGMPRTPLNVSLILAIYSNQPNYVPTNEASIMDRFMEIVLEKIDPDEVKTSSYDFTIKEDYLSYLVWNMVNDNKYCLSKEEYISLTVDYHKKRGFKLNYSKFDTLFFDKKILFEYDGNVYFRYKSIAEYYLAKKALEDDNVLKWMLKEENYLNYKNEINFLTGLNRKRKDIMKLIESRIVPQIEKYTERLESLNNYSINLDVPFQYDDIHENLEKYKLDSEEKNKLVDYPDLNTDIDSQIIKKDDTSLEKKLDLEILFESLSLYGRTIRNNELIDDIKEKVDAVRLCMTGYCILLAIFKNQIEDTITKDNFEDKLSEIEQKKDGNIKENDIIKVRSLFKVIVPLGLQNYLAENLGSTKLEEVIRELLTEDNDNFSKFMYTFLYSDLKLPGYLKIISDFSKKIKSTDLMKLTLYKLLYYYCTGYFRECDESRAQSLIADIVLNLKGSSRKGKGVPQGVIKGQVIYKLQNLEETPEEFLDSV